MAKAVQGRLIGLEKSVVVTIRLPADVVEKIQAAIACMANDSNTIGEYCKKAVIRHAFRHVPGGYHGYKNR